MDLFIITSVAKVVNTPLSYSSIRSVFSFEKRVEQTLETIKSVREKNPFCKIMIIECSNINLETEMKFVEASDYFHNFYFDKKIREIVNGKNKSWGECELMKLAINEILKIQDYEFVNIFKISGRYYLDEKFSKNKFLNDKVNIKVPFRGGYNTWVSTCLYSFPKTNVGEILNIFNNISNFYKIGDQKDIETHFLKFLLSSNLKINFIETLGVSGLIAVNGELCSH